VRPNDVAFASLNLGSIFAVFHLAIVTLGGSIDKPQMKSTLPSCALLVLLSCEIGSTRSLSFSAPLFWHPPRQRCFASSTEYVPYFQISRQRIYYMRLMKSKADGDNIIDAVVIEDSESSPARTKEQSQVVQSTSSSSAIQKRKIDETSSLEKFKETCNKLLQRLAALSLEDYKWRSAIFKDRQAERQLDESLARMRGETASYVRPMYADEKNIGPLVSVFHHVPTLFHSLYYFIAKRTSSKCRLMNSRFYYCTR